MARRGSFLSSLEEIVTITGERGGLNAVVTPSQAIIILEDTRSRPLNEGYTELNSGYYIGNICPPNYDICVNDLVTRQPRNQNSNRGSSSGQLQVLVVQDIRVIGNKQQLQLQDRDKIQ